LWDVHWENNVAHEYGTSPTLSGRAAYLDSGYGVTATISFSSDLGEHQGACVATPSFTLTHTGNASTGLSNTGVFDGIAPGVRCNGTYTASLKARNGVSSSQTSALQPFTYTHPSAGVAAPTVKAGSDGTSLVVSWAPPADATPDLVGYTVTRTFTPAGGGKPDVKTTDVAGTSFTEQVGNHYGGYSYTVQARYWGTGGPTTQGAPSDPSKPAQASVAAPSPGGGDTVSPGKTPGSGDGGGTGGGGGGGAAGTPGKPVIQTGTNVNRSFFPIPNLPRTETPHIGLPALPGISSGTTEVPNPSRYDIPEPGTAEAVKPKTPLSASAMVDHPSGGGLNGRTIALVVASVLVLGLIAAQLAFLSRRAAALELLPEDADE
jgi:hypothetical protein